MCGRYQFSAQESAQILEIVKEAQKNQAGREAPWGSEIFPSQSAPVLVWDASGEKLRAQAAVWGFPKTGGGVVINARAETVREKRMFRGCIARRRCVVASTGFFEWDLDRRQYLFRLPGAAHLYMAGIYDDFDGARRFCILTTAANDSMREIHDRMPVVLEERGLAAWAASEKDSFEILAAPPPRLSRTLVSAQTSLW